MFNFSHRCTALRAPSFGLALVMGAAACTNTSSSDKAQLSSDLTWGNVGDGTVALQVVKQTKETLAPFLKGNVAKELGVSVNLVQQRKFLDYKRELVKLAEQINLSKSPKDKSSKQSAESDAEVRGELIELYLKAKKDGVDLNFLTPGYPEKLFFFTNDFFNELLERQFGQGTTTTLDRDKAYYDLLHSRDMKGVTINEPVQVNIRELVKWALEEGRKAEASPLTDDLRTLLFESMPVGNTVQDHHPVSKATRLHLALGTDFGRSIPTVAKLTFFVGRNPISFLQQVEFFKSCELVIQLDEGRTYKSALTGVDGNAVVFYFKHTDELSVKDSIQGEPTAVFMENPGHPLRKFYEAIDLQGATITLMRNHNTAVLARSNDEEARAWTQHSLAVYPGGDGFDASKLIHIGISNGEGNDTFVPGENLPNYSPFSPAVNTAAPMFTNA